MDSYESDNAAYAHMRKHGIHRTKKSGPRKGQSVHETVGGKPFKGHALKKRTKKEVYSNMLRVGKEGSDHFQK